MSSFNYTDNFTGFNDLINRASFLTEAKRSPYAGYHDSFGPITKELRSAGFSSAPLDTINFIRTILYDLEIIDDDELAAAKRGAGFSAKKTNLLAVLDSKKKEIANNTDAIARAVKDGLAQYINRATTNRGREEKYAAQKAALELAKDIKAGADVGDAVEDAVGEMDSAEKELAQSIEMSKTDPTTFIEIKIRDADRINDVSGIVTKYANEDGLDVSGDTVQFSVDPDSPLAKAVSTHGIDKIEAALKRDVDKISDSVVVVMAPDEDYEQIDDDEQEGPSLANNPGGAPSSYAAGEEGGGLTTPEDEEFNGLELDEFLTKEQPEDDIPSTDYEDVLAALVDDDKKEYAKKKLRGENEEEFNYSPMLDSYQSDTAGYLTEQSAADKRNKKTEVKKQSFKERYKPKTHWQLEELRKYGL
tara:strand:- start:139 stop:1389 length:1251 start_codon:yes stop_codon:yes gene_type:complete